MPFYGSRISENMSRTPEGYLVCHNVPIARTGWQEYRGREIDDGTFGLDPDKLYRVYRSPEEVFSPATMASAKAKSVTDEHPPDLLTVDTDGQYQRGTAEEARRGGKSSEGDDLLVSDLTIKDPVLISKIDGGMREVSCGYKNKYVANGDDTFNCINIRINHIAVVPKGRAGKEVSIRDAAEPKQEKRKPVKDPKKNLFGRMLKAFAMDSDATPEEVADAAKFGETEDEAPETKPEVKPEVKPETKPETKDAETTGIEAKLDKLIELMTPKANDKANDDDDLIPEEGEMDSAEEEGKEKHGTAKDSARAVLLAMKPHVAKSNDAAAKKQWNESWKALNGGTPAKDGYSALLNPKKPDAVVAAMDAQDTGKAAAEYEASIKAHHRSAKK